MTSATQETEPTASDLPDFDAVVVGAGVAGLYAIYKLRSMGFSVRAYETGADVGGTWYWNKYPGLQCDIEAQSYQYMFDEDLFRGWTWSTRYARQPEMWAYTQYVADKLDLRKDIQFETAVETATFDESAHRWHVALSDGESVIATHLIVAVGNLSSANFPKVDGIESFEGPVIHPARWPDGLDLEGKRIGLVGTGSSGIQLVTALPALVGDSGELRVFQRTPQYVTPAKQRPLSEAEVQEWKDSFAQLRDDMRATAMCAFGFSTTRKTTEDSPEEQKRVFDEAWEFGAQRFSDATYSDIVLSEEANAVIADYVKGKIREIVENPEIAEKLVPTYLYRTRRPVVADGYYEAFNLPNVTLVDLRESGIDQVTPKGIRQQDGTEHELDILVFATGYDSFTGSLFKLDIRGRGGVSLKEAWAEGANIHQYLGVNPSGFPNLFIVQGPVGPGAAVSYLCGAEVIIDWWAELADYMRKNGIEEFEADPAAEEAWSEEIQKLVRPTLLQRTDSWWNAANVEGKPKPGKYLTYIGGLPKFREIIKEEAEKGYPGFLTTSRA